MLERDDADAFALTSGALPSVTDRGERVLWPMETTSRQLRLVAADGMVRSLGDVDVVFPALHGPWGEDGTIQGLFELSGIPYVGSGVLASAVAMDKHFTKTVLEHAGLPVVPWHPVTTEAWASDPQPALEAARRFGYPVFVKPARAGSSLGVSRVADERALAAALAVAFAEDDKALIEPAMVGREVEIAILGARPGGAPRASVAGEVVVGDGLFYDFDAKYRGVGEVGLACPAALSPADLDTMQRLALRAFEAIDARGLARVDFFLTAEGFLINEVNTLPGFTPISMFPRCWQESGVSYTELITELIELALPSSPALPVE